MRSLSFLLAVVLLAPVTTAQEESFFSEVMEVRVTNVDVVVTGRDGKPVTGLKPDDFELYEDGELKDITNFLEMRGDPSGSLSSVAPNETGEVPVTPGDDIRRRDITIFIDNSVLNPLRRNQILPALQQFVRDNVRAGDTVAIMTWAMSLKVDLEPTSDRTAIDAAVARLGSSASPSTAGQDREEFYRSIAALMRAYADMPRFPGAPPPKPEWSTGISEARGYAIRVSHQMTQRVEALKSVIAWRRGVEGRKILVMLTMELPMNPAEEPFLYLDTIRDKFENPSGMAVTEARAFQVPSLVEEIASVANSAGVTLYPIDAGGKSSGINDNDASSMSRVIDSVVSIQASSRPTLRLIAEETGGVALTGSDNWKLAFDTIGNDLDTYYSLGYRSAGERQDRMKKIEVRLKDKRHVIRTRRAVIEKTLASEMQDAVAANLFRPSSTNEMEIAAVTGTSTPKGAEAVLIPVTVTFPMDNLTLVPDGDDLKGKFAVYAAFLRKDGAVSKVARQGGEVRFPAKDLKFRREVTVRIDVTADAQTNGLSVGVLDEMSGATGFAGVPLQ